MNRRESLKKIAIGSLIPTLPKNLGSTIFNFWKEERVNFQSQWYEWHDMKWLGGEYWANPLQDWQLIDGKAVCVAKAANRNFHVLTIQKAETPEDFETHISIELHDKSDLKCAGLRLGAKGPFPDFRSAAVFGNGLDIGLNSTSELVIGDKRIDTSLPELPSKFKLSIKAKAENNDYTLLIDLSNGEGKPLFSHQEKGISAKELTGNFAVLADYDAKGVQYKHSLSFSDWGISSENLLVNKKNTFGPICFAQYTLNKGQLKLTAQCSPIESIEGNLLSLQIKENGQWRTLEEQNIKELSRAINFKVPEWKFKEDIPYRLSLKLPTKSETKEFTYEGTISKEPLDKSEVKAAVFSCNFHYGFPDSDIPENVSKLNPDVVLFLGDQFYEGTGGFGVLFDGPADRLALDYLRKWYIFGWSYKELFRHKPCAIIPDDHDVYHGNIWGEAGKKADTSNGVYAPAQDSGGYKMSAEWVNMVQFTQTSHLPDAYDPTPVKQGIGVYYSHWNYGGISFAIIEDRKFKSAPKNILPEEAEVYNGWLLNKEFDIKKYKHLKAELLGQRQKDFLNDWVEDWSNQAELKVVLSQTNFATVATLPKSEATGANIPNLPVPKLGEYLTGEWATVDMDSNGWPSAERDKAVSIIRKGFAFHIAGDQHLASFIQYGLDQHGDSGHAFAGPALNNIWPRRFWPDVDASNHTVENPAYLGDHLDGFGNKMTVKAIANPYQTGKEPKIIHDRATGFGLVTFNKKDRTIKTECWPRFVDPTMSSSQYPDWPITINQEDNFSKKAIAWLPTIEVVNAQDVVLHIHDESESLVYALRIKGNKHQPKVFAEGKYRIRISDPELGLEQILTDLQSRKSTSEVIRVEL
ncbi:MAG: alkaline phosphatase D family protein [Cytophagia bacterium]|nr:alkaline phosphatase D family protein [Cytophagia bacterium]